MDWRLYQDKFDNGTFTVEDVEPFLNEFRPSNTYHTAAAGVSYLDFMRGVEKNRGVIAQYLGCKPEEILIGNYDAVDRGDEVIPYTAILGNCDALGALNLKSTGDLRYVAGFMDAHGSGLQDLGIVSSVGKELDIRLTQIQELDMLNRAGKLKMDRGQIPDAGHILITGTRREPEMVEPLTWKEFLANRKNYRVDGVRTQLSSVKGLFGLTADRSTKTLERTRDTIENIRSRTVESVKDLSQRGIESIKSTVQNVQEKVSKAVEKLGKFSHDVYINTVPAKLKDVKELSEQINQFGAFFYSQLQGQQDMLNRFEAQKAQIADLLNIIQKQEKELNKYRSERGDFFVPKEDIAKTETILSDAQKQGPTVNEKSFETESRINGITVTPQKKVITGPPVYGTEFKASQKQHDDYLKKKKHTQERDGKTHTANGHDISTSNNTTNPGNRSGDGAR